MIAKSHEKFMLVLTAGRPAKCKLCTAITMLFGLIVIQVCFGDTGAPIVRAVLFTSPTCAHCAKIKEEVLPMLADRYGRQLQVVNINTGTPNGQEVFLSACMKHGLASLSVPLLIVGNTSLLGSREIPQKFPDLIEKYMAEGGIDWPGIPGLRTMLAASGVISSEAPKLAATPAHEPASRAPAETATDGAPSAKPAAVASSNLNKTPLENTPPRKPAAAAPEPQPPSASNLQLKQRASAHPPQRHSTVQEKAAPLSVSPADSSETSRVELSSAAAKEEPFGLINLTDDQEEFGIARRIRQDLYGNILSILVLAGMILTILLSPKILRKSKNAAEAANQQRYDWLTPFLTLAGAAVAAYLSHVEVREVAAVCGPVGDCNTVQQSEYAKLFGILPIGLLGLFGFLAILTAWALRRWGPERISQWAALSILGMTGFGALFSIYLTFLEPFVIGATCLWCLSSSAIMTILYVFALNPGRRAWSALAQNGRLGSWPKFLQPIK